MSFLGNVIWFLCGGFLAGLGWVISGCLWCITVVGVPVGVQCFKLAGLCFCPFGKEVRYRDSAGNLLLNILWLLFSGLELCLGHATCGLILCCTIIGIPFGKQQFKLARLSLMPFGAVVYKVY